VVDSEGVAEDAAEGGEEEHSCEGGYLDEADTPAFEVDRPGEVRDFAVPGEEALDKGVHDAVREERAVGEEDVGECEEGKEVPCVFVADAVVDPYLHIARWLEYLICQSLQREASTQ